MNGICICLAMCAAMVVCGRAAGAIGVVGQAVQRLHLSPQQLLSLRDVLGGVERGVRVEASGEGLFVLRDPVSMAYVGEFSVRVSADGALKIDRVSGPATLDTSQVLVLPIPLNPKSRAQIRAALAGSQVLETDPANPQPPALPENRIAVLKLIDSQGSGPISQTRAIFFRDGSGVMWTIHAPQTSGAGTPPAPIRISERYFSAVKSDGTHAWRDNVVEIASGAALVLSELEAHACPESGPCNTRRPAAAADGFHFIRWQHQLIAAVPPSLLAQLAPAPAPDEAAPVGAEPPSQTPAAPTGSLPPAEGGDLPAGNPPENAAGH